MAKHLKKKTKTYRLFSSKSPQQPEPTRADKPRHTAAPERGIPDAAPEEAELPISDMQDTGAEYGGGESEASELSFGDIEPTSISDAAQTPAPKKPPRAHAQKHSPKKKRRRSAVRLSSGTVRRIIIAAAVIIASAAAVVAFLGRGGGQQNPLAEGYVFSPKSVDTTKPDSFISETAVMVNDGEVESYTAPDALKINFGTGDEYTASKGVMGFRGDNFRSGASYGTADFTAGKFTQSWSDATGSLADASGNTWSGSGWTGQPLVVSWPDGTRQKMTSMYDWAREKAGLVEVIYPTMDGNIYFSELSTGKATRDPMYLGFTFKGTGALDPRGYPILYVGSGVNSTAGKSRVFVINLLDCSVMYRFGYYEPFARRDWNMWDASPLVDAKTDQLVYPGENGILYIIRLNTFYDEASGSLTVNPDNIVKWRYDGVRTSTYTYWTGFEASPVCWQGRVIMADNGGNLMCLDLNTLKLDWVCDVLDDTSCSPVLSLEEDGAYIYIGGAFHPGWRDDNSAPVPVWKINAVTGEVVWKTEYTCVGDSGLSSGVQGTLALGKKGLAGLVFVPVASTPDAKSGTLAALDTKTGKEVWRFDTASYSWSSPVDVYDADGNGRLVYAAADGKMYLLDGKTGKTLDTFDLGGGVEASPVVYEGWVVVGTRSGTIQGVKIG